MSESFEIRASAQTYRVELAAGLLERERSALEQAVCICDRALQHRVPIVASRLILIDANEQTKDLDRMSELIGLLKERHANRKTMLYAVGGGVVQDVACFLASVYMRGMKWSYFPTTLLGMADSCIGGKSSINAAGYKNLVGTFHPPQAVYIDPIFIESLTAEQRVAGLCEAVKICFARDDRSFERYLELNPAMTSNASTFLEIIGLTLKTKKWFIETDEFDQNERLLLNFGHTFGHAIEAATGYAISHGVAVGIGMLCAVQFSAERGHSPNGRARCHLLAEYVERLLAHIDGLDAALKTLDPVLATQKFTADKKHDDSRYWMIAPNRDGFLERVSLAKSDDSRRQVQHIFALAQSNYRGLASACSRPVTSEAF